MITSKLFQRHSSSIINRWTKLLNIVFYKIQTVLIYLAVSLILTLMGLPIFYFQKAIKI
jgi:hypothetical protein